MDLLAMGEMLVDFTPEGTGFVPHAGGAPANVAVMAARQGLEAGFLGLLGEDPFGDFLEKTLKAEMVEFCGRRTKEAFTTLAFVSLEEGERDFFFARRPGADALLDGDDLREELFSGTRLLHGGSFSLSEEPAKGATLAAFRKAKACGLLTSFDVNYRAPLWESPAACREAVREILPYVDFLKLSEEEARLLGPVEVPLLVETRGARGARACFEGKTSEVLAPSVSCVDSTGAGDAFWGAFLADFVFYRASLPDSLRHAAAAGALAVGKMGAIPALPMREEVLSFCEGA